MATLKKCITCHINKLLDEFHKNSSNKDGYQGACKKCVKSYAVLNKEQLSSYRKDYRDKNQEKATIYNKLYRVQNKQKISEQRKGYRETNKEIISKKKIEYERAKIKSDPVFKLRKKISLFVRIALNGNKSNYSILQYLPYTMNDLKDHIQSQFEPWMTWQNWGKYDPKLWDDNDSSTWAWQLDHIIPQIHLPYDSMEDDNFKKCWSLDNLRPLSAKENIILGSKVRSL